MVMKYLNATQIEFEIEAWRNYSSDDRLKFRESHLNIIYKKLHGCIISKHSTNIYNIFYKIYKN